MSNKIILVYFLLVPDLRTSKYIIKDKNQIIFNYLNNKTNL